MGGSTLARKFLVAAAVLGVIAVAAVIVQSRDDGATDFSDSQEMVERLEAAGIAGCRADGERLVGCFDAAGVAYFQGLLLDDDSSASPDVVAEACDPSTIVALFTQGQNWFGRVRAHPERASALAAALGTMQTRCADAAAVS